MRLDRFVSNHTGLSRKLARAQVRSGKVTVDGVVIRAADHSVDPDATSVIVLGKPITPIGRQVWMIHKPSGCVSATSDGEALTVLELIPRTPRRDTLRLVGRLDKDTTGLLLLTDDGALLHRLTHPKRHVAKVYELSYDGTLEDPEARCLAGLPLADGTVCRPATFVSTGAQSATLTLTEGRYHQVKRMIAALGGRVMQLHRAQVGGLPLDPSLAPGDARRLDEAEVASIWT